MSTRRFTRVVVRSSGVRFFNHFFRRQFIFQLGFSRFLVIFLGGFFSRTRGFEQVLSRGHSIGVGQVIGHVLRRDDILIFFDIHCQVSHLRNVGSSSFTVVTAIFGRLCSSNIGGIRIMLYLRAFVRVVLSS